MVKIYALKHPDTQEIRYIGKTVKSLQYRLIQHISRSKRHRSAHVNCWIYSLLRSQKVPIISLIEEIPKKLWEQKERYWIKKFPNLCNHQQGGGHGNSGVKLTLAHIESISKSLIGKPRDAETKLKISKSHKGKILSEVTKQKIRDINLGKKYSMKTILKKSKGGVEQYSNTGVLINTFITLTEASKATGFYRGNISSACNGRLKTYRGFVWKYKIKI